MFKSFLLACIILSYLPIATGNANNEVSDSHGKEIIQKVIERDNGFGDFRSSVEMTIIDKNGDKRVRKMQVSDLEISENGEKRLFVFNYPLDVKGTAVLSHTQNTDEKQWIFLPAFKRVKRISSANKSSPFVGSEFSYEDLTSIELDKYHYRHLKNDTCQSTATNTSTTGNAGNSCYLIEMIPTYDNSGYQKQIAYVDTKEYIVRRMNYYDRNGELLKSLILDDYKLFIDKYWRPLRLMMTNHQNNRKTLMLWRDVKYRNGFNDHDLSVMALKRAR